MRTSGRKRADTVLTVGVAALSFWVLLHTAPRPSIAGCACPGDCNRDCTIDGEEFEHSLRSIFDAETFAACAAADVDGDGRVSAADVVAIAAARIVAPEGCSVVPTATPTATATRTSTATQNATATSPPAPSATPTAAEIGTPASTWIPLPPLARGVLQEIGVAALDGRIYAIGGFGPGPAGRVDVFDIASGGWSAAAPHPEVVHHVGAASHGGFVFAVGGLLGLQFAPIDRVYRYDPIDDQWEQVASLPSQRGSIAVAVVEGRIHAVGGDASGSVPDHAAYDPTADEWEVLAPLPRAVNHTAGAAIDDVLYVVGGRTVGIVGVRDELYRYDAARDRWDTLSPMPTARGGHMAAALGGRLVVMGGEGNRQDPSGVFPQVEAFDPVSGLWTSLDDMAVPRHGTGAATVGDLIYVPGGADRQAFGAVATFDALGIEW